jgi:thiol:disulfide interchange protein DsbD
MKLISGFALLFLLAASASGEPVREGAVVAELVPAKEAISPGETILIALRMKHDAGWHTYWKSPGIVGVPTDLDWKLPKGFKAGGIQWPQPERVKMGPYDAYGYHGEVFLSLPFTAPSDAKPGTQVKLKARASWMCCSKTCHPAFADVTMTLPVSQKPAQPSRWHKPIAQARSSFPVANTHWKGNAFRQGKKAILTLTPRKNIPVKVPIEPYFFSDNGLIDSDVEQVVNTTGSGVISLQMEISEFGPDDPAHLTGIFYTKSGLADKSGAVPIRLKVPLSGS